MAQVQEIWGKFDPRERLMAIGALLVVVSWLLGAIGRGAGLGSAGIGLLAAIGVIVVLYLKYAPNQTINWPAPVPMILMALSALVAVIALLQLIDLLGYISVIAQYGGIVTVLSLIAYFVGAGLLGWAAIQQWQESRTPA